VEVDVSGPPRGTGVGRRARPDAWWVGSANLVAVLVLYGAVPVDAQASGLRLVGGGLLALVALAGVTALVVREIRRRVGGEHGLRGVHLVLALEVVLVTFAMTYYLLGVSMDGQMVGIATRLDALYFSATTMTTVGYGDVVPVGQLARGVVTVHLIFDVVFIAAVGGLLRGAVGGRVGGRAAAAARDDR
jgi:voltage-gated potassium channel